MLCLFFFCFLSLEIAFVSGHEVAKRDASSGKSYMLYERGTCVNVTSESTCPVSWELPAEYMWEYEYANWFVKVTALKDINDPQCKDALRAFYCSRNIPRCTGNEDVDLQTLCKTAQTKCAGIKVLKCDDTTTMKVNQTMNKCITVERTAVNMCPEPKHKMLENDLGNYKSWASYFEMFKTFLDPSISKPLLSSECLGNLKRIGCAARYCSDDEKRILLDYTREDCIRHVACVVNRLDSLPKDVDDQYDIKNNFQLYLDKNAAYCLRFPKASQVTSENTSSGSVDVVSLQLPVFFASLVFTITL